MPYLHERSSDGVPGYPSRSASHDPGLPPLRTLFFDDLKVGMTERLKKPIAHPVAELIPEKSRVRLTCVCKVGRQVVLDGEALVKVPREEKGKRPLMRL